MLTDSINFPLNQHFTQYATNAITSFMFKEFCRAADAPFQEFVVRQDMGCGSTVGPILSASTGQRTVDVGAPQWSMHSVRECMGCADIIYAVKTFRCAYENFISVNSKISVDVPRG